MSNVKGLFHVGDAVKNQYIMAERVAKSSEEVVKVIMRWKNV